MVGETDDAGLEGGGGGGAVTATLFDCSNLLAWSRALANACTLPKRCFASLASAIDTTCSTRG